MRPARDLRRWFLAAALGWAAVAFLSEVQRALAGFDRRGEDRSSPILWRLGMRPPARLASCLEAIDRTLPPEAPLTVLSPEGAGDPRFYRWRWAAYLLPNRDVLDFDPTAGVEPSGYVVALLAPPSGSRLANPLVRRPGCVLFRADPP
jgi:hypothetical protein